MLVLKNVPLQLRFFTSGFHSENVLRVITLEKNRLHAFSRKNRRCCCIAAEVSSASHVESFREKNGGSKGVENSSRSHGSTRNRRKKVAEDSEDLRDRSEPADTAPSEAAVEKAKPRKRVAQPVKPEELRDGGLGEKIENGSRRSKTPRKRVTGDQITEAPSKTPAVRRRKSSESLDGLHSQIIPAGDINNTSLDGLHSQIIPAGDINNTSKDEAAPQAEAYTVGLEKNTRSTPVRCRRKKKEPEESRSSRGEDSGTTQSISVGEEVSLDQERRSADSKDPDKDASSKVFQDDTFSAEEQDRSSVKEAEVVTLPGETQTPELQVVEYSGEFQVSSTVEYSKELRVSPTVEYSGELLVNSTVEEYSGVPGSPQPLYMQIEKRRLEEQQRRAGNASRKKKYTPASELKFTLDYCSKFGDVNGALAAYEAHKQAIPFDLYNFNVLLYLCSSAALGVLIPFKRSKQRPDYGENEFGLSEEEEVEVDGVVLRGNMAGLTGKNEMGFTGRMLEMFLRRGLEIYDEMREVSVAPDDATFTSLARLAVAKLDGDLAFDLVREMASVGLTPKLRCYGPALFVYFKKNDARKALGVFNHMMTHGVEPDEAELEILLHLASKAGLSDEVYSLLHQLRRTVRDVSPSTVRVIERWFLSGFAAGARGKFPEELEVMRASASKGGGWHGLGWLGAGAWNVDYTHLTPGGVCCRCGEQMITIDVDPLKTESFAESIASLASKREQGYSFGAFKDWLDRNEPYGTIVDGANVGFYKQRGEELNFQQLNSVVSEIYRGTGRWPLVILHVKRTTKGSGKSAFAQQLLRKLSIANALYTTPTGSNDDWYWLYAAVKCKSLLVSNDEMRDHIFQLLGRDYFPTWKERHQVRFHISDRGPNFYMPPPYSIIIQESVRGSWHVPVSGGDDISTPRNWLCVTRPPQVSSQ